MLSLPPHTSHKMQPLDKTFFFALKTSYIQQCQRFMLQNPAKRITQHDVGAIFCASYQKSCTIEKAVNGFSSTGIWQFIPDIFSDTDYASAEMTERMLPQSSSQPQPSGLSIQPQLSESSSQPQPSGSHNEPQSSESSCQPLPFSSFT